MTNRVTNCKLIIVGVLVIGWCFSPVVSALDKSRLWLPNKYKHLMPRLVEVAMQAEKRSRCQWVVNGELNKRKSTQENHYFIITCRDDNRNTYMLSYLSPVDGGRAKLVTKKSGREALNKLYSQEEAAERGQTSDSLSAQVALGICEDAIWAKTEFMKDVVIVGEGIPQNNTQQQQGFFYQIPFKAAGVPGDGVRYRAQCAVNVNREATVEVSLEPEFALTLCKDELHEETLLMRSVKLLDNRVELSRTQKGGLSYQIPFDAIALGGKRGHYNASCQVNFDGMTVLHVGIAKETVLALCLDKLKTKTRTMVNVAILDNDKLSFNKDEESYINSIAFNASSPMGKLLRYQATCWVSSVGTASVKIAARRK